MKLNLFALIVLVLICHTLGGQTSRSGRVKTSAAQTDNEVMSDAYRKLWNPEVQARIDSEIEQNRKADAMIILKNVSPGTKVKIEQISHDFIFGAHIFNFNQLGTTERNNKYKDLYGTLFNSATIAFYWKKFEMQPGRMRFREEYWDTEDYWNSVTDPKSEPHWRRPSTDAVVKFCESKGIRLHGHTIIWGNRRWQHPDWLFEQFCPEEEKDNINCLNKAILENLSPDQIEKLAPGYFKEMNRLFEKRVTDLANYYKDRIHSWDVVNESAVDFKGNSVTKNQVCKSEYGLMPGDYIYNAFKTAAKFFPEKILLNINDYANNENYTNQVIDLLKNGCSIDIMGSQMHLFNPQQCLDIADGKSIETPDQVWGKMNILSKAGLPIHLSEITITAPGDDEKGRLIQAVIARNLYRLWFSIKPMMGITWWNVVDDCGAPGEPTTSGLFTRNMEPKPSFYALDNLINNEWKTRMEIVPDKEGTMRFRGFKGQYRIIWQDKSGKEQQSEFYLKNNGDGLDIAQ